MEKRESSRRLTQFLGMKEGLNDIERQAKTYANLFSEITENFRADDLANFNILKEGNWSELKEISTEYRCRYEHFGEVQLMVYLNCFSKQQLREEFGRFLWEFDDNFDGRIQLNEFEKCLEELGRRERIGKEKVRIGLRAMFITVDEGVSFLKEGPNKDRIVDKQISGQLFHMFTATVDGLSFSGKAKKKKLKYLEVSVLMPYLFAYWIEYELKLSLNHRLAYEAIKGIPLKQDGSNDPLGDPTGLYLAFCRSMQRKVLLDEVCITYRIVVRSLMNFHLQGYTVMHR
jgi:Ca2+-binding EF-hand superfamily protein